MLSFIHSMKNEYGETVAKGINKYIDLKKKIEKCSRGISFINECLTNEKMPNFSRINLSNGELNKNNRFVSKIRNEITHQELKNKYKCRKKNWKIVENLEKNELWQISLEHRTKLDSLIEERIQSLRDEITKNQNSKLVKLGIKTRIKIADKNVDKRRNNIEEVEQTNTADAIFNLSDRTLSPIEENVLNKGLKFGIKNKKIDQYEILARFEDLAQSLDKLEIAEKGDELRANLNSCQPSLLNYQKEPWITSLTKNTPL